MAPSPAPPRHALHDPHMLHPADSDLAPLRARIDGLHQALIARDVMAQITAHDLRTPLNTLSGLLHMMEVKFAQDLPEKAVEYLEYMARAVTQMDALCTAFSDQARMGPDTLCVQDVDMRIVLDSVIQALRDDIVAAGASVQVTGATWRMQADPALLRLMVMHLLRNALQFQAPSRPLHVSIALLQDADTAPQLILRDNGIGFEPGKSNAIFLPCPATEKGETGIGLATCYAICKRHGWTISARSDGQTGATFELDFPKQRCDFE